MQSWLRARAFFTNGSYLSAIRNFCGTGLCEPSLILTDRCKRQLKVIQNSTSEILRVLVDSGGCSGFQYKFQLIKAPESDDRIIEEDGAKVIVDQVSLELLNGATLDYEEELIRSGFKVTSNPQAEKGCSCGISFALKMD